MEFTEMAIQGEGDILVPSLVFEFRGQDYPRSSF